MIFVSSNDIILSGSDEVSEMSNLNYEISFPGAVARESNQLAQELKDQLERNHPDVTVDQRREREGTQDLGTVLILILGSKAVIAVAKGIDAFLKKHQEASIKIKTPSGEVIAENITGATALAIIQETLKAGRRSN